MLCILGHLDASGVELVVQDRTSSSWLFGCCCTPLWTQTECLRRSRVTAPFSKPGHRGGQK